MSDIQLFRLNEGNATELTGSLAPLEKSLQTRIDSLGLDENGCPVIVEYKRHSNENVINQGLFYLDWLMDHQAEFRWLVMEKLGKEAADNIEWAGTRLLCIAADFTRYDQYAVQQIPRNIELVRYKLFGEDLLLLELVNAQAVPDATVVKTSMSAELSTGSAPAKSVGKDKSLSEQLALATPDIQHLYEQTKAYLLGLGEDVQEKPLKLYTAFRRLKNFACVIVSPSRLLVMLKLDPTTVALEEGFSRDVSQVGHWGTGDTELCLRSLSDLERAKPLLDRSYSEN